MLLSISSQSKQTEEPSAQTVTYMPFHEKVLRCPKQSVRNRCLCSCNEGNNSCVLYPEIFQVAGNWHCTLLPTQSHNALFVCFSHVPPALFRNSPFRAVPCFYRLFLFALFFFFSFKTLTTAITPAKPLNKRSSFTQGALEKMVLN